MVIYLRRFRRRNHPLQSSVLTMISILTHPSCATVQSRFSVPLIVPNYLSSSSSSLRNLHFSGIQFSTSETEHVPGITANVLPEKHGTTVSVTHQETTQLELINAADVVRIFYDGINRRDLDSVENLIAENCIYEDLLFTEPFVGRKAILRFFKQFIDSISTDLQFAIDDISKADQSAVGVTWHLEWKGKPFPFSKGCSFYRLEISNGLRQITYGRDSVEPALKPGDSTLVAIRGVTWLLQRFPQLSDWF